MFSALVLCTLAAAGGDPAPRLELFAKEGWYREQEGKEQDFIGTLRSVGKGGFGFGRFNPFRLEMDKDVREVYIGGKPDILTAYVGLKVKITGKPVEIGVEGKRHREIWPARLEVVGADKAGDKKPAILARGYWPHGSSNPDMPEKATQFVFRSAADLIMVAPYNRLDAIPPVVEKMASAEMAKILKVPAIDWKTQMLIVVTGGTQNTGGFRIGVSELRAVGEKLVVDWFLQPPTGAATDAFTHPAEVILTNRFEGKVEFQMVDPKKKLKFELKRPIERLPIEGAGADKADLKVHAQSKGNYGVSGKGSTVIRNAEDLARLRGAKDPDQASDILAKQLKVPAIDWKTQMVVVVSGGVQRSGGFSVDLVGLTKKEKDLTVRWKLNRPKPGSPVTLALTHPTLLLLMDRFEGEIHFDPPSPKGKLDVER